MLRYLGPPRLRGIGEQWGLERGGGSNSPPKIHIIRGAPPETFSNAKYDAPEEVSGDRKCFDSP